MFAVPRQTITCAVASDYLSEVLPLSLDWKVSVSLAPVVRRFQRAGEVAFRRDLTNDVLALSRPPPDVGEAEEVERRGPTPSSDTRRGAFDGSPRRRVLVSWSVSPYRQRGLPSTSSSRLPLWRSSKAMTSRVAEGNLPPPSVRPSCRARTCP